MWCAITATKVHYFWDYKLTPKVTHTLPTFSKFAPVSAEGCNISPQSDCWPKIRHHCWNVQRKRLIHPVELLYELQVTSFYKFWRKRLLWRISSYQNVMSFAHEMLILTLKVGLNARERLPREAKRASCEVYSHPTVTLHILPVQDTQPPVGLRSELGWNRLQTKSFKSHTWGSNGRSDSLGMLRLLRTHKNSLPCS